jgi:hypothetical protein
MSAGEPQPADTEADVVEPMAPPVGRAPISSSLPSRGARILAFLAIVVGGLCGGLIGWKVTVLSVSGPDDGLVPGLGALAGALVGAGGVSIAAVLVLRAMTEWSVIVETGDPSAGRRATREREGR